MRVRGGQGGPFLLMADRQTKGRGRRGRVWESPTGNFSATLVWPVAHDAQAGDYSFITVAAIHRAVVATLRAGTDLRIKWPNDLMIGGLKCSGILLERPEPDLLLIGTGVNLAHAPEGRARIADYADVVPSPRDFAVAYMAAFGEFIDLYAKAGLAPILMYWRAHGYPTGQEITVTLADDQFAAVFEGIAPDGALQARLSDGTLRLVHAGDVFFADAAKRAV